MNRVLRRGVAFFTPSTKFFEKTPVFQPEAVRTEHQDLCEPLRKSVFKRLPWLILLLFLGTGVSAMVGAFESVIAHLPVIMCFQSLILDMAGNVGTQSLAVAIRELTDSTISTKQKAMLVIKECNVGLVNGLILGVMSFVAIGGYLCICRNSVWFAFSVSGCLGIAMVVAMVISSFSGVIIPLLFHKIGIDPAVASGPLITTINDMVAVVTYYGVSWIVLINFMHL